MPYKNKRKRKEYDTNYLIKYRQTEKYRKQQKKYDMQYLEENRDKINQYVLRYYNLHKYDKNYKTDTNARGYAHYHKQKGNKCAFNPKHIKNLHFHHTNYKKREGFTLCASCHKRLHNNIKNGKKI